VNATATSFVEKPVSRTSAAPAVCTVIVTPRDHFSTTEKCIRNLLKHTPERVEVIAALGGAPDHVRFELLAAFGDKVRFIFTPRFMNTAELRNLALKETKTGYAACIDADVFVRPGWLEPLMRCQRETGAALVVPMVLDRQNLIHTAGNDFYVTTHKGKKHGRAELRFAHMYVSDTTNLKRRETDFGEIHCHFVEVEKALSLGVYDERLREGGDFDSGLTWAKAGCKMMFEPESRVYLHYTDRVYHPDDVKLYMWKWDAHAVLEGFGHFQEKWGVDMVTHSDMEQHMLRLGGKVGFFTRLYPESGAAIAVDRFYYEKLKTLGGLKVWIAARKNRLKFARAVR